MINFEPMYLFVITCWLNALYIRNALYICNRCVEGRAHISFHETIITIGAYIIYVDVAIFNVGPLNEHSFDHCTFITQVALGVSPHSN